MNLATKDIRHNLGRFALTAVGIGLLLMTILGMSGIYRGMIDKARRQIGLFRVLLVIISTIIMALILYTLTLDKIHDIALLKLMGARNSMIVGLILQQALLLGVIGYGIAYLLGQWVFPKFPRRVLIGAEDLWGLALVVVVISVLASLLGIWKALRVEPNKVLS